MNDDTTPELDKTIEHRKARKGAPATASTLTFVADQRSDIDRKADEKNAPKAKPKAKTKAERELAPTEPVDVTDPAIAAELDATTGNPEDELAGDGE